MRSSDLTESATKQTTGQPRRHTRIQFQRRPGDDRFQYADVHLPELGVFATLTERIDKGPVRSVLDANPKRAVGWYASHKNGRSQFYESRNERHAFYLAEVATEIVAYRAQPHHLDIALNGKTRRYTPDREDHHVDGQVEIIEVKGEYDAEADPQYQAKLEAARLVYQRCGYSFRILEQLEIEAQPRFDAAKAIQDFRSTAITQVDEDRVIACFEDTESIPLLKIRKLWHDDLVGFAKLAALMIKRTVHIDFEHGLSDVTPVRLIRH